MITVVKMGLLLQTFDNMCVSGVTYSFGAKAPGLGCDSHMIHEIDCSGLTRYLLNRATLGTMLVPDGSVMQHEYCARNALRQVAYANAATAGEDRLFWCFLDPTNGHAGHTWLLHWGETIESHGGVGCESRRWDTPVLRRGVSACYELLCSP
jgi:cell wall-associated NlpC family hydrolase